MATEPYCPDCKTALTAPSERIMPDGVVEHRCPSCSYQIPLYGPSPDGQETCPGCGAAPIVHASLPEVDGSGLLGLLYCDACGCLLGSYWGMVL